METFYLLLLVPIIWAIVAKWLLNTTISWKEMGVQILVSVLLVTAIFFAAKYGQTVDTEIWNGQITKKNRDHGSYVESYDCNCRTTCSGSGETESCTERCDTCYEDHYTVDWHLNTTVGNIQLQYLDRTSRSVYNTPDPTQYTNAYIGEPCSVEKTFKNYIKAVPESIFNEEVNATSITQFANMVPAYPRVYDYYKVSHVIPVQVNIPNVKEWDNYLNEKLKILGARKEVNIIVVVVNSPDQSYKYALEKAWLGGKQNDVVVVIGAPEFPKISWVDTFTYGQSAGNSLMVVEMRDGVMALKTAEDFIPVIDTITGTVNRRFDRKLMSDFEYLNDEIQPPIWVIIIIFLLSICISVVLTYFFNREDLL